MGALLIRPSSPSVERRRVLPLPGTLPVLLLLCASTSASGQTSPEPIVCDGLTVSSIEFKPSDPSFEGIPASLRGVARTLGLIHTTTRPRVLGRFMQLEEGEPCSELRRAESERALRAQPFLADVVVRTFSDGSGGARVEVETIDEIPTAFSMRFRGLRPRALRIGHSNIAGEAVRLAAGMERGFAYRTGFSLESRAYAAFGRPYTLELRAERAPLGSLLAAGLGHPFLTELQRTAWHMGFEDVNAYLSFVPPAGQDISLQVRRRLWDVGGVRRVALGRWSTFVGMVLTHEEVRPSERAVIVSDSGLVADTSAALAEPVPSYRHLRANAVLGLRRLTFTPVRGFDALMAVQDVAEGIQVATLVGWGIPSGGLREPDMFFWSDLYAGLGSERSFAALRLQGELRHDPVGDRWDSVIGSGRLSWYFKPSRPQVLVASAEIGGAWRERIPFQLRLGDSQGGVRGYAGSRAAGGVRSVVRLEERWSLGEITRHMGVGVAAFADAGRVWAGEAPFGTDSGTRVGIGVSLLAAFPTQSQRLWRLDLAVPISADPDASWEVRLSRRSARNPLREPRDVTRARAGAAPSTIFLWP